MYVDERIHVNHELGKQLVINQTQWFCRNTLLKLCFYSFQMIPHDFLSFQKSTPKFLVTTRYLSQSQVGFNLRYWLHCEAVEYEHGSSRCVLEWFRKYSRKYTLG